MVIGELITMKVIEKRQWKYAIYFTLLSLFAMFIVNKLVNLSSLVVFFMVYAGVLYLILTYVLHHPKPKRIRVIIYSIVINIFVAFVLIIMFGLVLLSIIFSYI